MGCHQWSVLGYRDITSIQLRLKCRIFGLYCVGVVPPAAPWQHRAAFLHVSTRDSAPLLFSNHLRFELISKHHEFIFVFPDKQGVASSAAEKLKNNLSIV